MFVAVSLCGGSRARMQNLFTGILGADTFATSRGLLPPAIKQLDLSRNPGLIGHLPPAGSPYTALRELVRTNNDDAAYARARNREAQAA